MMSRFDCPLAEFTTRMSELEDAATTGSTPETMRSNDLLPISVASAKVFMRGKDDRLAVWVLKVVEILNYYALGCKPKQPGKKLTPAQELMLTRLVDVGTRISYHGGSVRSYKEGYAELVTAKFDYSGEPVQYMQELVAEKVIPCWPKVGEAAVQDAVRFVDPQVRAWLEDPIACLLPVSQWPDVPPLSRVRATDTEWEKIVRAGYERGMMRLVRDDEVFRDTKGRPVLNGAGGVRKVKTVGGEERELQRFISILVPSNTYQKNMPGDDDHLPYLGQMSMMEVEIDEDILIDSEDLTSCFNLFRVPPRWSGFFAFAKKVSARVFGGPPNELVYVGMAVVPMGWINSVALMQTVVRTLVFARSNIPEESEISKLKWFHFWFLWFGALVCIWGLAFLAYLDHIPACKGEHSHLTISPRVLCNITHSHPTVSPRVLCNITHSHPTVSPRVLCNIIHAIATSQSHLQCCATVCAFSHKSEASIWLETLPWY